MTDLVRVEKPQPHTSVVTLDRPDRLNAMSIELVIELDRKLDEVAADNDTWVVVLTGAGRAFCSGLDLKDYGVIPNIDGLQVGRIAQRSMRYYSRLMVTLRRMPQPVIAAVNGPSYGGGMCLALGAELRVAAESATFNATGIVNGLTSTELGASWLLPRLVGAAHSHDLLLTGRKVDADEAYRMGLVSRVFPDDALMTEVLDDRGGHVSVQSVRPRDDEGHPLGEPREPELRGRDRDRGPQPADAGVHREPARGDPCVRPASRPRVHRRAAQGPVRHLTPGARST